MAFEAALHDLSSRDPDFSRHVIPRITQVVGPPRKHLAAVGRLDETPGQYL